MKKVYKTKILIFSLMLFLTAGCKGQQQKPVELRHFPFDSLDGVITQTNV